ncbi:MAG TPA: GntR family transcriptional regulator [Balneolales bacterium]|nr:GntR family transcriptional regulator [Balneolales bacterium]
MIRVKIDHSSPIPLYKQIEDALRKMIDNGEYGEGEQIPKEEDLASWLGVSRNTVRQGIYKLVLEGLLIRKKGVGTVVAPHTITTKLDEWHSFTQEMMKRGVLFKNYLVRVHKEKADSELSSIFKIKEGTKLVKLVRIRGDNKEPFVYFISWFHPRIGLTGDEDFNRSLYKILEQDLKVYPSRSKEELKAMNASRFMATKLNIPKDSPVLFRKRLVYDAGDRIIEYNLGYYRGDKFTYSIDIKRNS